MLFYWLEVHNCQFDQDEILTFDVQGAACCASTVNRTGPIFGDRQEERSFE